MSSSAEVRRDKQARRERAAQLRQEQAKQERRRRRLVRTAWIAGLAFVIAVVTGMMITSQPKTSTAQGQAAEFALSDTSGEQVSLADFRGGNVLLYFNEGAGCQSCLVQMAEIEKYTDELADLDVTVLPIVMNSREQILADMAMNDVDTPFLLDDGTVSEAYGTLGKGMHAGLPGHSFVLIDADGTQRWYGEYPSMWLAPDDLFAEIRKQLES